MHEAHISLIPQQCTARQGLTHPLYTPLGPASPTDRLEQHPRALGVAAVALFLSTVTDSPLAAALGAVALLVASTVLVGLEAASSVRPYLPTRYWLAFVDLFRDPVLYRDLVRGVLLQAVYVAVFLGAAWANFTTKDVTS